MSEEECLLCFETMASIEEVCPHCNKAWCANCNKKWKYQQKYSLQVPVTCPFCRAPLLERREHLSFNERMIRYTLSMFALGLLIILPIIELVNTKSYVLLSAFTLTLVLILLLLVLQGFLYRRYQRDQNSYELDEDNV